MLVEVFTNSLISFYYYYVNLLSGYQVIRLSSFRVIRLEGLIIFNNNNNDNHGNNDNNDNNDNISIIYFRIFALL